MRKIKKITIYSRIMELLKIHGALQVVKITELLNSNSDYKAVTRNTVNTILYTNKDKFKNISWGRFDLLNGSIIDIKEEILRKFINNWKDYSKNIKFIFTDEELRIINNYKKLKSN